MTRRKYGLVILTAFTLSCTVKKELPETTYRSNFAELGFFITQIRLLADKQFTKTFRGDLVHTVSEGTYRIEKNYLLLDHRKKPVDPNWNALLMAENLDTLNFQNDSLMSDTFLIRRNKLSQIYNGKKIRKAPGYNKRKKFFLFGSHYYQRKYFLRKVDL